MTSKELLDRIAQAEHDGATWLDLSKAAITVLPAEIGRVISLTALYLNGNYLQDLPAEIGELTNLTTLELSGNQLQRLPAELANLGNLAHLALDRNELQHLSYHIGSLANLSNLTLISNRLQQLPESLCGLTRLTTLDLRNNHLDSLPSEMDRLTSLANLLLNINRFTQFPPAICHCSALASLHFANNRLGELPSEIGGLGNLTMLDLRNNLLRTIPPELGALTNLTMLDLRNNQLERLPAELGRLAQLAELDVTHNPLSWPPAEIVSKGTRAICSFLRAQLMQGTVRLWRSKLVVVGEGAVGKTSLVNVLSGKEFNHHEETTHGLRAHKPIELPHPTEPGVAMKLFAWDFGGQAIYHATHQFFLTDRALFLLVWNARLDYSQCRLEYWLEAIRARAPGSPIVIVATHLDERRAVPPPLKEWAQRYRIVGYQEVSNKTKQGFQELKTAIAEAAAALPLMGHECPRLWIDAADKGIQDIQRYHSDPRRSRPYVQVRELYERLESLGVSADEIDVMLQWFHDLGGILYFPQDAELRDMVVLSPWQVSRDISKVLDHENELLDKGIFTVEHQQLIWPDLDANIRAHLIRLMERFDLSYRIPESTSSLIVARLPADPPDDWEKPWNEIQRQRVCHELRIRYQLNTVPAGIPSWFIARSHRFSMGLHWRHGALFSEGNGKNLGLVRIQPHQRVIDLTVRGPFPHNFFALLRDGLEITLGRYPGLEVRQLIPCPCSTEPVCSHLFDYQQMLKALERGKTSMECQQSFQSIPLARMLHGWCDGQQETLLHEIDRKIREGFARQERVLGEQTALIQRQYLTLFKAFQKLEECHCPNVFLVQPIAQNTIAKWFTQKLRLQLLCQAPGCWHSAGEAGQYTFHKPADWWPGILPYVKGMLKVLRCAAPLAGEVADVPSWEEWTKRIEFMEELVKQVPNRSEVPLVENAGRVEGAALRALRKLLDELDPQQRWGGLQKVLTPEGHYLWLCPRHAATYQR